jgi:DNA-binding NarL/FixJ family response regulator
MPNSVRLLLIDTPMLPRRSLAALLNRRRGFHVVGEAETGSSAVHQARALQPDVAVVELDVPDGGPQLVADLSREAPGCAVLVLTQGNEGRAATRALQAGARGYLDKNCEPDDLVRTIERVRTGELVVAPRVAAAVVRELSGEPSRGPASNGLTEREIEVLRLVAYGRTNPEIARELCITQHTVKGHLSNILNKLGLENRVQLATYAMQLGLAEPPDEDGTGRAGRAELGQVSGQPIPDTRDPIRLRSWRRPSSPGWSSSPRPMSCSTSAVAESRF